MTSGTLSKLGICWQAGGSSDNPSIFSISMHFTLNPNNYNLLNILFYIQLIIHFISPNPCQLKKKDKTKKKKKPTSETHVVSHSSHLNPGLSTSFMYHHVYTRASNYLTEDA